MSYGIIYIAHNSRDGDTIFKVGATERRIEDRMRELTSGTSNLGEYSDYLTAKGGGFDRQEPAKSGHSTGEQLTGACQYIA